MPIVRSSNVRSSMGESSQAGYHVSFPKEKQIPCLSAALRCASAVRMHQRIRATSPAFKAERFRDFRNGAVAFHDNQGRTPISAAGKTIQLFGVGSPILWRFGQVGPRIIDSFSGSERRLRIRIYTFIAMPVRVHPRLSLLFSSS